MIGNNKISSQIEDKILKNILKECYWDYSMDISDLKNILKTDDSREMKKLFSKIIYNSKDKLLSLKLFTHDQLSEFFSDFKVTYNEKYIMRHLLVLKSLLLNEKSCIKGLEWKKT